MSKIIFAGDSNLDQYVTDAQKFGSLVAIGLGYPLVINSGVSGNKSSQLLARLATDVIAPAPQVAVIMIGTNDIAAAYDNDVPNATMVASYIANMEDIIDDLVTAGIVPVIVTPPPARVTEVCLRFPEMIVALAALCSTKGVDLVPVHDAIAGQARAVSKAAFRALYRADPDAYHLTVAGHAFVAGCVDWSEYIPAPDFPPFGTVLNQSLPSLFGNVSGYTFRVVISSSILSLPGPVTLARLTLKGHADEPFAVNNSLFAGVHDWGQDATSLFPVRVGKSTSFTVPQGGQIVTDPFPFSGGSMIVSGYSNAGPSADRLAAASSISGATTYYKPGNEAAVLDVSGFTAFAGYLSLVTKVETDGF